jgi:hypothetical protein
LAKIFANLRASLVSAIGILGWIRLGRLVSIECLASRASCAFIGDRGGALSMLCHLMCLDTVRRG